ncbi:hypothetical protein LLS1_18510 [Leifsonia sp. LS1]|uniref:DUF5403 family protein n=1 Tax=Leifsonia sp. LS1 TaxID=2828483 RepID=UPI001CFE12F9|nr:DUF5403 family protein [Leifsonia sp. LS1]GIT80182.1 hypothetical protein LLS1_18510 [Leifsonia sp. LS1]
MAEVFANAGIEAALLAGESDGLDEIANTLLRRAKANAAKHAKDGTFENSLEVVRTRGKRGVTDRLVQSTDPLAVPKELGHALVRDGETIGYVKGQHSLGNAVRSMPAVD